MDRLVAPISWKAAAGNSCSLTGYASTFGNVDQGGDIVVAGAFKASVARINAGETIPLLADHVPSTAHVLGTIYAAREDKHGLEIEARFASTARAQEVRTLLLKGNLSKMSIGYSPELWDYEPRGEREIRLLKQVRLWETSVVVFPMNEHARVTSAKQPSRARSTPWRQSPWPCALRQRGQGSRVSGACPDGPAVVPRQRQSAATTSHRVEPAMRRSR